MATEPSPQRAYRAACPNCGAPVEFRSAASALAVCSFCKSTLAREGDALRRIGQSAELFEDYSPLQLGASGRWQGAAFTIVGRLQMRYAGGQWNEWHAIFDGPAPPGGLADGSGGPAAAFKSGWLSEDNGGFVFSFESAAPPGVPAPEALVVGSSLALGRDAWSVGSVTTVKIGAAEGELPYAPALDRAFVIAELRNANGEVASIDYSPRLEAPPNTKPPRWSVGRGLQLADLALSGLRSETSAAVKGQAFECPSCGTSLEVQLSATQSITCHQCKLGGRCVAGHRRRPEALPPGRAWRRRRRAAAASGCHRRLGAGRRRHAAVAGGRLCRALHAARHRRRRTVLLARIPALQPEGRLRFHRRCRRRLELGAPGDRCAKVSGSTAKWQGAQYRLTDQYVGQITYVLGEFYWKLARGQQTYNTDFQGPGGKRLNRERTGGGQDAEVTWSAGSTLNADVLMKAFKLKQLPRALPKLDASPISSGGSGVVATIAVLLLLFAFVVALSRCDGDDCDNVRQTFGAASNEYQQCLRNNSSSGGYRSSGGSYGGFSSGGGGHK